MYYIYMLRCKDNSIYTGITTDVMRRFYQHRGERGGGAKYTKSRIPLRIEMVWECESRAEASRLEYRIKKLSKTDKEKIIKQPVLLQDLLENKLDIGIYRLLEVTDMVKDKILELKDKEWEFLGEVNPDMSLGMYGLFWGDDSKGVQFVINGTFDEFDEAGVCISSKIDCSYGEETASFDGDSELMDFVYKQIHSSEDFTNFRHEYEKMQYDGVTTYFKELIKDQDFLSLEKEEVEAEDGIAVQFQGLLESGLFISGLIYEIEDEYRNSYIDFAYNDVLYMTLDDLNFFVKDPYLKDYIVYILDNVDFTC